MTAEPRRNFPAGTSPSRVNGSSTRRDDFSPKLSWGLPRNGRYRGILGHCGSDRHFTDIVAVLVSHVDHASVIRVSILRQLGGNHSGLAHCRFRAGEDGALVILDSAAARPRRERSIASPRLDKNEPGPNLGKVRWLHVRQQYAQLHQVQREGREANS